VAHARREPDTTPRFRPPAMGSTRFTVLHYQTFDDRRYFDAACVVDLKSWLHEDFDFHPCE